MPNKLIRDLFTGKLKEVPFEGSGVIASIPSPGGPTRNVAGAGWPMISEAAAINPEDVPREQARLKKRGIYTEYTPTGEPIFRSPSHRKAYCEAVGLYDRNGGYSDPQPKHFNPSDHTPEARMRRLEAILADYD